MNTHSEIIVIGGGAAGMCAAIVAARIGGEVTLLEQNNELGKKILATGNGRCNYTNMNMKREYYYSSPNQQSAKDKSSDKSETDFLDTFLEDYPTDRILKFFADLGISPREREGYVYPFNDQSMAIRESLAGELFRLGVKVVCGCSVNKLQINHCDDGDIKNSNNQNSKAQWCYKLHTDQGTYTSMKCIVATGGNSGLSPKVKYKGYDLIKDTKHSLQTLTPALTGLKCEGDFFKRLSGVRSDVKVTVCINNKAIKSDVGEIQLADYGISGIPVFQISRIAAQALQDNENVSAILDFFPHMEEEEFLEFLLQRQILFEGTKFKLFLNGLFKEKLGLFLTEEAGFTLSTQVSAITKEELKNFVRICKNLTVKVIGSNDYTKSQVTAGGIPLSEITNTFESKLHKGLYLVGEVLDVDGICGGYNLHFAWGSGIQAGLHTK